MRLISAALAALILVGLAVPAAADPTVTPEGAVTTSGQHFGDASALALHAPATDVTLTASTGGYLIAGADGGVFTYGDAIFHGSLPGLGIVPSAPIVGIAADPHSDGYWLLGADGGVFAFGAPYYDNPIPWLPPRTEARTITPVGGDSIGYEILDSAGNVWRCVFHCAITNPPIREPQPALCEQGVGSGWIGPEDIPFLWAVIDHVDEGWHCFVVASVGCESDGDQYAANPSSSARGYGQFLAGWYDDDFPGDWTDPVWQARAYQYLLSDGGTAHWNASRSCWG